MLALEEIYCGLLNVILKLHEPCWVQEFLKRESSRSRGGIPFMYVVIVGLLGIFLGYLLKKT